MKTKTLIAAMIGLSLAAIGTADAAGKHKRYKVQRHGGAVMSLPAPLSGPPWAQPWECFTDEGYGRYRPCNAGRR
jgi:hypothetical protein